MEKYYCFGGVELVLRLPDNEKFEDEGMLAAFRTDRVTAPHVVDFTFVDALEPPAGECVAAAERYRVYREGERQVRYLGAVAEGWEKAYARIDHDGREHRVSLVARRFPERVGAGIVLNCLGVEHLIAGSGGVILHSAYVDIGGRAVLFTAPSGTGKSTQAELWRRFRGAEIINGDRSVVRFTDSGAVACGLPYAGSSGICKNRTLPLAAVVYLSHAKETTIRRLSGFGAFRALWEGCNVNTWEERDVALASETVRRIAQEVPVYHLACTPDETAVRALEEVL